MYSRPLKNMAPSSKEIPPNKSQLRELKAQTGEDCVSVRSIGVVYSRPIYVTNRSNLCASADRAIGFVTYCRPFFSSLIQKSGASGSSKIPPARSWPFPDSIQMPAASLLSNLNTRHLDTRDHRFAYTDTPKDLWRSNCLEKTVFLSETKLISG